MILADKIIKLRKQFGWSQEELAEKMNVSRQSVSKWESTNSIPDLNRIILLAEIFAVSTDFLLKDENETCDALNERNEPNTLQIGLEQALRYVENKIEVSHLVVKGVVLCVCSTVPLFFFLTMAQSNRLNLSDNIATAMGIIAILVMVSVAVSFFIKTNQYEHEISPIDNETFELAYGVHSVFKEKLQNYRATYNRRLSLGIFLFIISFTPLMVTSMFFSSSTLVYMMLIALLVIVSAGIYIVAPASAQYEAYNNILKDNTVVTEASKRAKRAEKLAAFYWPLVIAVYLGWSLWSMKWGETWIVWPVAAVLFAALVGLMELLNKDER